MKDYTQNLTKAQKRAINQFISVVRNDTINTIIKSFCPPLTQKQIGKAFGVTREAIKQVKKTREEESHES